MIRLLALKCLLLLTLSGIANTIIVKNAAELAAADNQARPGDIIILQNGEWKDVHLKLECNGTSQQPITFRAQSPGKVVVSGQSSLSVGGSFIIVDGLYFANGYAGSNTVIEFRVNKNKLANDCRVTNCVINDFNNPKRMDENSWVLFYGKRNRIDHCSFFNKTNMGVLMAVILDDERSRENGHIVDHNYFGVRPPLASNGGEIIRIGVSQHCQFNSNTVITDNCFDRCDGEAEVISIKSGSNIVRNNVFRQCQGALVLRHGNDNLVENNIFLGHGKSGTGGVRVINKGQWVVNNYFYQCRGTAFRSPLTIMNGIPNSPAHRYVQVTDAVIANNTFLNCSPASFCEGRDTERTLPPAQVYLINNAFYNDTENEIYRSFDDISGINFAGNSINSTVKQKTATGFEHASFRSLKAYDIPFISVSGASYQVSDSIQKIAIRKLGHPLSLQPGFSDSKRFNQIMASASVAGAKWYKAANQPKKTVTISCRNTSELRAALNSAAADNIIIRLTSAVYHITDPVHISRNTEILAGGAQAITFRWPAGEGAPASFNTLFEIKAGARLTLSGLHLDLAGYDNTFRNLVSTDSEGKGSHSSFIMQQCTVSNIKGTERTVFRAAKSTICDSVVVRNCTFENNEGTLLSFTDETDKKGYYNAEKVIVTGNRILKLRGVMIDMLRGGNDESTMGPSLLFRKNTVAGCQPADDAKPLINLVGTQVSDISDNSFTDCHSGGNLIFYTDYVKAIHLLRHNIFRNAGRVVTNKFVEEGDNKRE